MKGYGQLWIYLILAKSKQLQLNRGKVEVTPYLMDDRLFCYEGISLLFL